MGKSIQDQLRALGLGGKNQSAGTEANKRKGVAGGKNPGRTASRQSAPPQAGGRRAVGKELSLKDAFRLRELQNQKDASDARGRKREEDRRRRELNTGIRAIVEPNRLNSAEAEIGRNFLHKNRIRRIYVTAEQLQALNAGKLGVVYLSGSYHLMTTDLVATVAALSPDHVPDLSGGVDEDPEFPVPDDLVW